MSNFDGRTERKKGSETFKPVKLNRAYNQNTFFTLFYINQNKCLANLTWSDNIQYQTIGELL